MWEELGISGSTAIIILIVLYFIVKWAVKNGIKEAYQEITGKKLAENLESEACLDKEDGECKNETNSN